MINVRRLAAVDLSGLGPAVILSEFALGTIGPVALGVLTLRKSESTGGTLFGLYLLSLGINYVPLLLHAISLVRHRTVEAEVAAEPGDRREIYRRYRRQSLLLLIPLLVPIAAIAQRTPKGTS